MVVITTNTERAFAILATALDILEVSMELNCLASRFKVTIVAEVGAIVAHVGRYVAAETAFEIDVLFAVLITTLVSEAELLGEAGPTS